MHRIPEDTYKPLTQGSTDKVVLMITGNKVEDLEFFYPYYRFIEAGFRVDVATLDGLAFKGMHDLGLKESLKVDNINPSNYCLLYLPGGKAPDKLKSNEDVLEITRSFVGSGKPVAAICHGPQILAAANVIHGRRIAAWPEVEEEIRKAGGYYMNEATVVDANFITARWPADLPMHLKRTLEFMHAAQQNPEQAQIQAA